MLRICAGAVLAIAVLGFGAGETRASGDSPKIDDSVLRTTASGRTTSFVVYLRNQADLSAAYAIQDQDARGWYVYRTLRETATSTQAPLRAMLDARGVPYTSYWAANMIVAQGDRALVDELAARQDVHAIEPDERANMLRGDGPVLPTPVASLEAASPNAPAAVEWGVNDVKAPAVWSLGYTGQGMVVASADTGVRWTHAALRNHYRGWNGTSADNNYNWHDAVHSGGGICGANTVQPCDDNGHGTHTTGTAVGDDGAGNQIGVAPGAKWIGCRNMDQGTGSPATYTECFQFFIAPTNLSGQNADPTKRPDVVTDSWVCPASEGCAANTLQTIVENTEAAGIFVEASAGNAGPNCSTVSDPPAIYASAFSTGAVDVNNTLAGFSSRGPVTADGSNRMKPDVVAPGVNVRSATNTSDSSYAVLSGTSMAGPHVSGVVALVWSARPDLVRNIAATKQVLTSTANPAVGGGGSSCGGSSVVPNNNFGWGLVNALAASSTGHVLTVAKSGGGAWTVTSSPAGISCGTTCSAVFADGTAVTLTATADSGSTFAGWSGDCSGTGPCTVTMSADHAVTATFEPHSQPRALTVTKAGSGTGKVTSTPAGIDCGTVCSATFGPGTSVTLKASPGRGSRFSGWSGDCSGTAACTLTMNAAHAVTATFVLKRAAASICVVPRVRGATVAAAKRTVVRRHCSVGRVTRAFSARVRTGRVISQKPRAGERRANGAKVNLVVSRGRG
jgi:serine protease AprX